MSLSEKNVHARVARGAALLDLYRPYWYESVSVGALNLATANYCVLGQMYGNYDAGLTRLFPTESAYVSMYSGVPDLDTTSDYYGFSVFDLASATGAKGGEWAELTQAWRDLISERRCRVLNLELRNLVDEKVNVSV